MSERKLFRDEAVKKASNRLEGKVVVALPASLTATVVLLVAMFTVGIIFAFNASFARKETVRGWITWSSGLAVVRAPSNTVLTVVGAAQGDWVREGQLLAWADASRLGGATFSGTSPSNGTMIVSSATGQIVSAEAFKGQSVNQGTSLFTIAPDGGRLIVRLAVPTRAAGFIELGQDVYVAVDAFPYQKFGSVRTHVFRISGSPMIPGQIEAPIPFQEASYLIDLELSSSTIKAYSKTMNLENGMLVTANIVIDRRNLFEWLFDPLFAAGKAPA